MCVVYFVTGSRARLKGWFVSFEMGLKYLSVVSVLTMVHVVARQRLKEQIGLWIRCSVVYRGKQQKVSQPHQEK